MMSPVDVWEHYDKLIAYGAEINMAKLFSGDFHFYDFFSDRDFIKDHWEELVNRGVSPDLLADKCYIDSYYYVEFLECLLDKNITLRKIFELAESGLGDDRWYEPEDQIKILTWFYDHGIPKADIQKWIKKYSNNFLEDYIVKSDLDFYKSLLLS